MLQVYLFFIHCQTQKIDKQIQNIYTDNITVQ